MGHLDGAVVVVPGAGGNAGGAVVRRLAADGAIVVAADVTEDRVRPVVAEVANSGGTAVAAGLDLGDEDGVHAWAAEVQGRHGRVDGVVHLVGGYVGAPSFVETDLQAAEGLHTAVAGTLARTALAFRDALVASPYGRFVIVSAPAATRPTGGSAGYAAAKAAAEAWTLALADDFRTSVAEREPEGPAAVILVIKALVTAAMRAEHPDRGFEGSTSPEELAAQVTELWRRPAAEVNGQRVWLTEQPG